jgi:hypothetical protein
MIHLTKNIHGVLSIAPTQMPLCHKCRYVKCKWYRHIQRGELSPEMALQYAYYKHRDQECKAIKDIVDERKSVVRRIRRKEKRHG